MPNAMTLRQSYEERQAIERREIELAAVEAFYAAVKARAATEEAAGNIFAAELVALEAEIAKLRAERTEP